MHFRQAEFGRSNRDAVVTGEGDFQSATQSSTMNSGYHGFGCTLNDFLDYKKRGAFLRFAKFFDVRTGNVGTALADDEYCHGSLICIRLRDRSEQTISYTSTECVYWRVINPHDGHAVSNL